MTLDMLLKLIPPPRHPVETGTAENWHRVEAHLGTELPQDYKDFISTYGTGYIGGFLCIHNPFSTNAYLNLMAAHEDLRSSVNTPLGILASTGEEIKVKYPYSFYPEPDGILLWGTTDNGDCLFWQTKGSPNEWSVVTDEVRGTGFANFSGTMTSFIARVILGDIHSAVLPTEHLEANRHFDVYEPENNWFEPDTI